MLNVDIVLDKLSKSKFRSSFHLKEKEKNYVKEKGMEVIEKHTLDFLNNRIRVKALNDGKQTPYKGHPVFIAQHACACCCRGCISKWHKFPLDRDLTDDEIDYLKELILKWIEKEMKDE